MSDSKKRDTGPYHDEGAAVIQVTPGQLVGAAAFLLVAGSICFFAGMFAQGLRSSESEPAMAMNQASPPKEPSDLENVSVIPAPDPPEPEKTEKEPEETKPPAPEPRPAVAKPETKPEPTPPPKKSPPVIEVEPVVQVEKEPEPEMKTPEQPAPAAAEQTPEPEPIVEEATPAIAEPEPAPMPEPAQEPAPNPLPELPASGAGPFTIQVMSIGVEKRAQAERYQRDALEDKNVQVELVESADGKLLRAFVGSYATREDAEKARAELARSGFEGCFIKKRD